MTAIPWPGLYVGCAGWSVPKEHAGHFPAAGSHLQRYASRFPAVEINSSFYRPHRPATYARWAATVPDRFRFAGKVPREITLPLEGLRTEKPGGASGPRYGHLSYKR